MTLDALDQFVLSLKPGELGPESVATAAGALAVLGERLAVVRKMLDEMDGERWDGMS